MEEIIINVTVKKRENHTLNCIEEIKEITITKQKLEDILRALYFAQNTIHIVGIQDSNYIVKDYKGTNFIYHQMVFNMIYDKFGGSTSNAKEKISNLIGYMADKLEGTKDIIVIITEDDLEVLKKITIDKEIRQCKKDKFLEIMKKIKIEEEVSNEVELSNQEVTEIFNFINNVRNNFFHGTKKAQDALEKCQNRRLEIYSIFLSNISSRFIEVLEKEGFILHKDLLKDDLLENLGLVKR